MLHFFVLQINFAVGKTLQYFLLFVLKGISEFHLEEVHKNANISQGIVQQQLRTIYV